MLSSGERDRKSIAIFLKISFACRCLPAGTGFALQCIAMLRITTAESAGGLRLVLEGRLTGAFVQEAAAAWIQLSRTPTRVEIDLCEVLAVDEEGRRLLARMADAGVQFVARGCAMREMVREIAETAASGARAR